jgi:ATP-binding cassette, subfamily A (ABC1), member 3
MKGIEVDKGIMDVYQHVGICPQFDALYEVFTVREHLELFGRMKGLNKTDLQ